MIIIMTISRQAETETLRASLAAGNTSTLGHYYHHSGIIDIFATNFQGLLTYLQKKSGIIDIFATNFQGLLTYLQKNQGLLT